MTSTEATDIGVGLYRLQCAATLWLWQFEVICWEALDPEPQRLACEDDEEIYCKLDQGVTLRYSINVGLGGESRSFRGENLEALLQIVIEEARSWEPGAWKGAR